MPVKEKTEYEKLTVPFLNRGLHLRKDAALLGPDEHADEVNIRSIQEGTISSRTGHKRLSVLTGFDSPHTLHKLRTGSDESLNRRYVGEGEFILRVDQNWATPTTVASDVVNPADAVEKRWRAAHHAAGSGGDPWIYFATPKKMLRDYGPSPYATLRQWGIFPPAAAASTAEGTPFKKVIRTTDAVLNPASTTAYEALAIAGAINLGLFDTPTTKLSGLQKDGYDSEDYIEFRIQISAIEKVDDIRLQFEVATGGAWVDYYEKSILTSQLTPLVRRTETADETLRDRDLDLSAQIYGPSISPDEATAQAAPIELRPAFGALDEVVRIPKKDFMRVGQAGAKNQDTLNWASIFNTRFMVKSNATGYTITILAVSSVSMALIGGAGPNSEVSAVSEAYDYLYCFRDVQTGELGNPSVPSIEAERIRVQRKPVAVTCHGTADLNISTTAGENSIAIFRRGGVFVDGLYRLVGYATNPGETAGVPNTVVFTDTQPDANIASAPILEFTNDAPVTSRLKIPYRDSIQAASQLGPGWSLVNVVSTAVLRVGTALEVRCADSECNETVIIQTITSGTQIRVFFQNTHVDGDELLTDSVNGQPCSLVAEMDDSLFLAGDENNPHILYKSKSGRTHAFPVINEDGTENLKIVGTPSNPINGITEFRGVMLCMNLNGFFEVGVYLGIMQDAVSTPAQRGLYARHAWAKGDNQIFYLGYDGVYTWSGGQSLKISDDIDWMFKNRTINGKAPIDLGQVTPAYRHQITFEYHKNTLFIGYRDTSGNLRRLIYETAQENRPARWHDDDVPINRMLSERDTGKLIQARFLGGGGIISEDDLEGTTGTSDAFTDAAGENGTAIAFRFKTGAYTPAGPSVTALYGDVVVELTNPTATVTVKIFYDHSGTPDGTDTFTIAPAAGRRLVPLPLQQAGSPVATHGKQARALAFEFSGSGTRRTEFHSLSFHYIPIATMQRGRVEDYKDLGYPHDKRLQVLVIEYDTHGQSITFILDIKYGIEGSTEQLGTQQITLTGAGRSKRTIQINDGVICKMARLRPQVAAANYEIIEAYFRYEEYPPDIVLFTPWSDEGHPYEKHLLHLYLDVDTAGQTISFNLESEAGVLQSLTVNTTEATRTGQIPLNQNLIAKKVRLKVTNVPANGKFQLFRYHFEKIDYPPDTIYATEWRDEGTPYDKYFQQVILDVNTNGQNVPLIIEGDGGDKQTVTVNSTLADPKRNITLNPQITAKKARLKITPGTIPGSGRFQLFSHAFVWLPADKGPVKHSFDWDDLGHPFDKRLKTVTLEYDKGAPPATMLMDILTGIDGTTQNVAPPFVLTGTGRSKQTFAIADNTFVKMIRFRPSSVPDGNFKHWEYRFDFDPYPADIVLFTDKDDVGWPCDKILRTISLEIDTGGVAATVDLMVDGTLTQSFSVTSSANDRVRILTPNSDIVGRLFWLQLAPGGGGKTQVFGAVKYDVIREPCAVTRWDSYETGWGIPGFRILRQIWLHYICAASVTFSIYRDGGTLFLQKTLPAHTRRDVERFFLPDINGAALNKSKIHRFVVTSASPFKLYEDLSKLEVIPLGVDQRQVATAIPLSHRTKIMTGVE